MSWRGLDHQTLYEMVVNQGQGPEISRAAEDGWRRILDVIVDVDSGITAAVRASANEWEGSGGDATRHALSPLAEWVLTAAADASRTATSVTEQAAMAANTRRLVADNPPPQNVGQHLHSFFGGLDGDSVYLDQAAAVDQLMITYEQVSEDNKQRFDTWSVPPSVVVTPAATAGPSGPGGPGGSGGAGMPETGGLGPAGGSGIASTLAPGGGAGAPGAGGAALPGGAGSAGAGSVGAGGAAPGAAAPGAGAGVLPGAMGPAPGGSGGTGGVGAPGAGSGGAGGGRSPGAVGGVGPGLPGSGPGGVGAGAAGAGTATGGRGLGTGGLAHPSQRPLGSPGGSGTGPGPWSRAGTGAGGAATGATALRPSVPGVAPRASAPDWRSVLLPPEREAAPPSRAPGETAARSAGPGAPGGSTATPAAAPGSGPRAAGSAGVHGAPMMGGGAGGAQPEGRRRPSYLIDDSDAFVDKRWFTEPVITPDDPL